MLIVEHISKSYGNKRILKDVSFHLRAGTLTALTGENGSGKSTLLKIITGEIKADAGIVTVHGKTGYCPQESLVFPLLTINENLKIFSAAYGIKNQNTELTYQIISILNLFPYLEYRVDSLSGGTRQKLNLLISLLHNPEICILDEPYGGFDWETYHAFMDLMVQLKKKNKCILLITHLLSDLSSFDTIMKIKSGEII